MQDCRVRERHNIHHVHLQSDEAAKAWPIWVKTSRHNAYYEHLKTLEQLPPQYNVQNRTPFLLPAGAVMILHRRNDKVRVDYQVLWQKKVDPASYLNSTVASNLHHILRPMINPKKDLAFLVF
jgi:hypothetical protein